MTTALEQANSILRRENAQLRSLMKMSLRTDGFNNTFRDKLEQHFDSFSSLEQELLQLVRSTKNDFIALKQKNQELEKFAFQLDTLNEKYSAKIDLLTTESQSLKKELETAKVQHQDALDKLQQQLEQTNELQSRASTGTQEQGRLEKEVEMSKEQNKKLIELLHKMEKKTQEKAEREAALEEECLTLRENVTLMHKQVEKIEKEVGRKIREKDSTIVQLQKRCRHYEKELEMNKDLRDIMDAKENLSASVNSTSD